MVSSFLNCVFLFVKFDFWLKNLLTHSGSKFNVCGAFKRPFLKLNVSKIKTDKIPRETC